MASQNLVFIGILHTYTTTLITLELRNKLQTLVFWYSTVVGNWIVLLFC